MACYRVAAKTFMLLIGVIFWGIAAGLLYLGGFILYTHGHYDEISTSKFVLLPGAIILLSGFLFVVLGVIGCSAVWTESRCLLATFFTILVVIFSLLVSACVFTIMYKNNDLEKEMETGWADGFKKYLNDTDWQDEVDYVQSTLHCCGIHNATDWLNPKLNPKWAKYHFNESVVPGSCCGNMSEAVCPLSRAIDKMGCTSKVMKIFNDNFAWIISVAIVLSLSLLIGVLASCAVMCTRREGGCRLTAPPDENYETLQEETAPIGGRGAGLRV